MFPILLSAINLKQVEVEFNSAELLDQDKAEKVDNYTLEDANGNKIQIVDADVDENVVTLSVAIDKEIDNQSKATLTIDKKILGEEQDFDVEFFDITIPKVIGAEVIGSDTVKIYFSEPVKDLQKSDVKINGGDYFIKKIEMYENNTVANVITYSDFDEDEIKVTVKNSVEDFAGFNLISRTLTVNVIDDNNAPEIIGYEEVSTDSVTLIFNEDIIIDDSTLTNFYHTNTKNPAVKVEKVAGNKIKVVFADTDESTTGENVPLPEGYAYIYIKGDTIVDLWGNAAENTLLIKVEVEADTEKPAVKKVEATQTEVKITFTENVYDGAEDEDNYTILDSNGDEMEDIVDKAVAANDVVTLKLDDELDYGTYTLIIKGIQDKSGNKMNKASTDFDVDDDKAPSFPTSSKDVVFYDLSDTGKDYNEYKLVINYNEPMAVSGKYSVVDLDNYILVADNTKEYVLSKLDSYEGIDDVDVEINATQNNKVVEILIQAKGLELDASDKIVIGRIADAAGNYTAALSSSEIAFADGAGRNVTFKAEAVDTDEIKVKFSDNLEDFDGNDLMVVYAGSAKKLNNLIKSESESNLTEKLADYEINVARVKVTDDDEAVLILDNSLNRDATFKVDSLNNAVFVIAVDDESANRYGESFKVTAFAEVDDKIAPAVAKDGDVLDVKGGNNTVTITFAEKIDTATVSIVTFEVEDRTVDSISWADEDENGYATKLVLNLEKVDGEDKVVEEGTEVTQAAPLKDANGNTVSDLSFEVEK